MPLFTELTLVLFAVVVVSILMKLLKQPLVVGYIITGILVGPVGLNLVHGYDTLDLLSKFGITILLFIVGLHLSPRVIKEVGSVSTVTGIGQVLFTSLIGFGIALALGLTTVAALYVAIALTFSSTIIVLKLLSDKGHTATLYGKIAIGFLLVQDIVATFILLGVSAFTGATNIGLIPTVSLLVVKALGVAVALFIASQWILPRLTAFMGKSQELLFVFSLAWGLGLAALFDWLGFSIEIGALIAGVTLSSLTYAEEVSSKLRPLRDFFIIIFFIVLGSHMAFSSMGTIWLPVVILSAFVLVGNPVIVVVLMNLLGYHKRTGFMAGLTVAQISEFSLILATLGMQAGHLNTEVVTIITMVGLITISISTYFILYSENMYPRLEKLLSWLELKKNHANADADGAKIDIILFGCDRTGSILLELSKKHGHSVAIVDYNPEIQKRYEHEDVQLFYGDAGNKEFLTELSLGSAQLAITSIPSLETNLLLIKHLMSVKKRMSVIVFAQSPQDVKQLYEAGASYVVLPHVDAARAIVREIGRKGITKEVVRELANRRR